ncbi:glycoside hydrolase family 2 [Herbiconiux sp. SALV-R1]|nr:glycoside hydrolase family 2 TIM barrel-domain containing protein [Herbiconiux sp. SALV-R1]QJU55952.1 glycoside hydrolase family 2 [Herbiconiux sp. SALV-R1]
MTPPDATTLDVGYPRPQLVRASWCELSGAWDFAWDDELRYEHDDVPFRQSIEVPFPPESPASGIGDTALHQAAWYRRTFGAAELREAGAVPGAGGRVLLHFGAVDHDASVWVNGSLVATHSGGQTPFDADITSFVDDSMGAGLDGRVTVVVRAVDRPDDVSVLRGKQDWREEPHAIWYHRTTGIWQPVWLEWVPQVSVADIVWRADAATATVEAEIELSGTVGRAETVEVALRHDGDVIASTSVQSLGQQLVSVRLVIPRQLNGQQYEELLWSPDRPTLIGATVTVRGASELHPLDAVSSYLGLRSVTVAAGALLLNDRPVTLRAVLAQNYWPATHLAATAGMLRREVELILELGFNAARVHQKAEDPRFLYWADRLGLMLWGETASAYAFDPRSVTALVSEWTAVLRRDQSHPSIVAWVPLNESWGVQHIAHDARQRAFSRAVTDLTRALDGTRPVISNDGWEHTDSDIMTIHDYEADPAVLTRRYGDREELDRMIGGFGPAGRRLVVGDRSHADRPIMLTEFGGVSLATGAAGDWGYSSARDTEAFEQQVTAILVAVGSAEPLAGFCYTQLTDTGQETNGLLYADRSPKFPLDRIRAAVRGTA